MHHRFQGVWLEWVLFPLAISVGPEQPIMQAVIFRSYSVSAEILNNARNLNISGERCIRMVLDEPAGLLRWSVSLSVCPRLLDHVSTGCSLR